MGQDWHEPHAHLSLVCFGQALGRMLRTGGRLFMFRLKTWEDFLVHFTPDILNMSPFPTQGGDPKTSEEDQLQRTAPR